MSENTLGIETEFPKGDGDTQTIEVEGKIFFRENLRRFPEMMSKELRPRLLIGMGALAALGSISLIKTGNPDLQAVGFFLGLFSTGSALEFTKNTYEQLFTDPFIKESYPDIIGKISFRRFQDIISDGIRGFYFDKPNYPYSNLYSTVPYKEKLIEEFVKEKKPETARALWELVFKTPDPELKMALIGSVERNCKNYLQEQIASGLTGEDGSPLEKAVVSHLALKWGLIDDPREIEKREIIAKQLELLDPKVTLKNADNISGQIVKEFPGNLPETLVPFVKLYVLRKIMEALANNRLPRSEEKKFIEELRGEVMKRLQKFDILGREAKYNPDIPTVGLEMQPEHKKVVSLRTNVNDVQKIIAYASFVHSKDKPFEIVLPPTRTPIAQLLILQELLILTGIPIELAGIQINFGGIGETETVRALQRIVLAAGRLNPDWKSIKKRGDLWDLGTPTKSEVNIRKKEDPFTKDDIVDVNPPDLQHPEFRKVGELRASVSADTLFVFSRGLIAAHRLATFAKAYERQQGNASLMGIEVELAKRYRELCLDFDEFCDRDGLPLIDGNWSKNDWKRFASLVSRRDISDQFRKMLSTALR